jgi:hypothetical protein
VQVDELRLHFSKLSIGGVQGTQEDGDVGVALQSLEQVVAPELHFLRVAEVCNLLLLGSLVLATNLSVVHACTDVSSACHHAVVVHSFPVSS